VKALGVIRDADQDATYAFHSIRNDLQAVRLPVPEVLETLVGHNPRVGVMLLPGGNRIGMLEDLCLDSIAQDSVFLHCVTKYFQCLEQQGIVLRDNVISKAKIQVFLASREKPGLRLGEAAGKGYWPWDNQVFEPLKIFLQQIVEGV
jgi:hypothetical protein